MSDRSNPNSEPLVRTINGQEVRFAELSYNECAAMLRENRAQRRAAIKQNLEEAGVESATRYSELRDFDLNPIGDFDWALFFNSHEGKIKILEKSLEKASPGTGRLAKDYNGYDMIELCGAITYTPITYKNKEREDGEKDSSPFVAAGDSKPKKDWVDVKPKAFGEE